MPRAHIIRTIDTPESFRVSAVASLFDVPLQQKITHNWDVNLPLDEKDWQIGLIVGPSGCGKSTIACELWPDAYVRGFSWDDRSILDNFPVDMESKAIVAALTSVGFSSPPDWVKPYGVLSTGQQMRADLARALCTDGLVVFDEFTSVVDRTVAQIGSAALAKAVRKTPKRQFIAVTCHEDVLDWLTPDWTYEPLTETFCWRSLQRPSIDLSITRCHPSAWSLFAPYHYLSANLNPTAVCYIAEWNDIPVSFVAVLALIGFKNASRISRVVVLSEYQGIGLGTRLCEAVAALYRLQGRRMRITTSHPGMIAHMNHSQAWSLCALSKAGGRHGSARQKHIYTDTIGRANVTFEYVGAA